MRYKIFIVAAMILFAKGAIGYNSQDNAQISLRMQYWELTGGEELNDVRTVHFIKKANNHTYSFLMQDIKKDKFEANFANNFIKGFYDGLKTNRCNTSEIKTDSKHSTPFHQSIFTSECQSRNMSSVILLVDADPLNLYIFTYTTDQYPLTPELRNFIFAELHSIIRICYEPKNLTLNNALDNCYNIDLP